MSKRALSLAAFGVMALAMADQARAEIVVLKNGRTMSVQSYKTVGDMALMVLRAGGEVTFPSSIVLRVEPDEAPYPVEEHPLEAADAAGPPTLDRGSLVPVETLNARPFADLISAVAASHDMDIRLVHAVIEQESNYQARARSKKGARGLMQLMPATARHYGVRNSYDPRSNLEAGIRHLKDLMSRLELPAALAAYNAGEATIQRYGGLPPFPETQNYVRSILRRLGR
jgi:hypothetical protein